MKSRRRLLTRAATGSLFALVAVAALGMAAVSAAQGETVRVSVDGAGNQANGYSNDPTLSADGRFVAFLSPATNLVVGDTNGATDIFVKDRDTGAVTRVSVHSDGTQSSNESYEPAISADGRYVAFTSLASNLVDGDTNATWDIFVHDRVTGSTTRVSVHTDGTEGSGASYRLDISADGRYVTFDSEAGDLVAGDTNFTWDAFVHDRVTETTTRVSVHSDGTQGSQQSLHPAISGDGRYVAFESGSPELIDGDTNNAFDVYRHDMSTGTTIRVSVDSDGVQATASSAAPSITADGASVSFHSLASDLVDGDTNGNDDVFTHDVATGVTTRVSVRSDGAQGTGESSWSSISGNGRYVAFRSDAPDLVGGDTNANLDVFVHDRTSGSTSRVSVRSDGSEAGSHSEYQLAISTDGRYVAFASFADNLVDGDTNADTDVFVHQYLPDAPPPTSSTSSTTTTLPPGANRFVDDDDSIFEGDIEAIASGGITKGCNPPVNDRFCPDDDVTRGQMAAFLNRAADPASSDVDAFVDDDDSEFENDIDALAAVRITKGCNPPANDRFCPQRTLTRGEMAALLRRALRLPASEVDAFVDDDDSIFEADLNAVAARGIAKGCNPPANDRVCPGDNVTRGQMAAFLNRAYLR